MDLRVEQVAMQWDTTRGHLRRLDRAGQGLHITANDLQVELGTRVPFYMMDPDKIDYTTKNTRWSYLWESTYGLDLRIEIYNFWTPKLFRDNDRNIMEVAMEDKNLISNRWKMLHHINQCRLYLRAFNISDLTRDGLTVYGPYLDGTERGEKKTINIPKMRRPTDNQWRLWKSFLFRNFLSPGTNINPKLGNNIEVKDASLELPVSEIDTFLGLDTNGVNLEGIRNLLPESLKCIVGELIIPDDGGLAISEAIVEGVCIGASDGSLVKDFRRYRGAHGYALRGLGTNEDIQGYGPSPTSDKMSSLTTENYGLIGILILLHMLCKKYQLCRDECFGSVIVYIDNKTVVERGNNSQELINLSDYNIPDQDLWSLTTEIIKKLPIRLQIKWVRGHQDRDIRGEKIYGPFTTDVQMNILVDDLASKGMKLGQGKTIRRPNFSTSVISVYDQENVHISDVRGYMTETVNGKRMIKYVMSRRGWSAQVIQSIEWEGIEAMMRSANPIRRTRLLKMLHNWQNTGKQKRIMRDARLKLDSDNPLQPTEEEKHCELCPEGCGEEERELHYLHCPAKLAIASRVLLIRKVLRRLKVLRTYEGITSTVGHILDRISRRGTIALEQGSYHRDGRMSLEEVMKGQELIGWNEFCQGYCHKGWARIQGKHYKSTGVKSRALNIERWKKMFCTILGEFCMDCWNVRNEAIHGKEIEESRKKRMERIKGIIKGIYKKRNEIRGTRYYRIFKMPLKKRLKMGVQANTLWIGMAEESLRLHREMQTKNTIDRWLQPT